MIQKITKRCAIALAAWLPFFAIWFLVALSFARDPLAAVLMGSLVAMGSAGLLGIAVWYSCQRWPWPAGFTLNFYLRQVFFALTYALVWISAIYGLEFLRVGRALQGFWSVPSLARHFSVGIWFYALFAGFSYAVQTRTRLREKETMAARAEALATAARLDALRARLNPHFLFNALHTLGALVKFRPELAEGALERLGDMLRYALKEDGRELVEFGEEYEFTRQYLAFEQLRYEDRLKVDLQIDPESYHFDVPPFSMQTLAENAVHHAISIRPEGGSIWITCSCHKDQLRISVRDDGPGGRTPDQGQTHQFGLRSLRGRLQAAYGPSTELTVQGSSEGFEACFVIPSPAESLGGNRKSAGGTR